MAPVYATKIDAKITAAINQPFTPVDDVIESIGRNDPSGFNRDIRRVSVTNAINMPFGRFMIELAPRAIYNNLNWAQIIKPYSRMALAFQRIGDPQDSSVTEQPVPLMVGLVDTPSIQANYSSQAVRRSVTLTGRMLSSVLSDHRWWFHSVLSARRPGEEQRSLPSFGQFYTGEPPTEHAITQEAALRALGLLAIDPNLFLLTNRSPARVMEAAFKFFVVGDSREAPFIKVNFADGRPLSSMLKFDGDLAAASYFDPAARLVSQLLPAQLPRASCWDIMRQVNEDPYQEIFSEVRGDSIDNAFVEVVARKAPFAGRIDDPLGLASVVFGVSGRPPLRGASLFDQQHPGWDRDADTVYVGDGDVMAEPTMRRSVEGAGRIFTLYQVTPRLSPLTGNQGQQTWQQFVLPIPDEDPESPSYIWRYGVRPFEHALSTIPAIDEATGQAMPDGDIARRCGAYAALAREWFYRLPEMWSGSYLLKGNPHVRAGKRLVDVDRKMEFYVTAVEHTIDNENGGLYTTTAQVTRGWELDTAV